MDPLDTAPLRDQRTMVGDRLHASPAEVEEGWRAWVAVHGIVMRRRAGDLSTDLRTSKKRVPAYVTGGKWMAMCPACNDGIACWPGHGKGCCLGCGTIYPVAYPSEPEILRAVDALKVRPEAERNWRPQEGETVADLLALNEQRGWDGDELHQPGRLLTAADIADVLGPKALEKLRTAGRL